MKLDDTLNGILFLALGLCIALYAQTLQKQPQIEYGSGFLPGIVGTGMALAGLALILRRIVTGAGGVAGLAAFKGNGRRGAMGVGLFVGTILIYILLAQTIGFLLLAPFLIFGLVFWFERRWKLAALVGVFGTLALHSFFYQIMQAPLPWGILTKYSGVLTW